MDSMILIEGGSGSSNGAVGDHAWYCRSTAILRMAARLHPQWLFSLIWLVLLIPACLRDAGYKLFASVRYRVFGKIDPAAAGDGAGCRLVTKAMRGRFLEYRVKDLEKAWRKKEKEEEDEQLRRQQRQQQQKEKEEGSAPAAAPAVVASPVRSRSPSSAAAPPLADLTAAAGSAEILAQTDAEIERQHCHAHAPGQQAAAAAAGDLPHQHSEGELARGEHEAEDQPHATDAEDVDTSEEGIKRRKQQPQKADL